jgi:hypothetical protein
LLLTACSRSEGSRARSNSGTSVVSFGKEEFEQLIDLPVGSQQAAYGSAATMMSIVAGFIVTMIFFFASSVTPSLEDIRRRFGPPLNRTLVGAFLATVFGAALTIAAILLAPRHVGAWLFVGSSLLIIIKLTRVAFFGWGMLTARYQDARATRHQPG